VHDSVAAEDHGGEAACDDREKEGGGDGILHRRGPGLMLKEMKATAGYHFQQGLRESMLMEKWRQSAGTFAGSSQLVESARLVSCVIVGQARWPSVPFCMVAGRSSAPAPPLPGLILPRLLE
jgi:hypothetical protein